LEGGNFECGIAQQNKLATAMAIQCRYLAGTLHYCEQQLEHHRTQTFQEEYLAFLKKHDAHFDEKNLWDQPRPIIPYPPGRFFWGTLSQALRAWLRSACPSGTKSHSPSEGHEINKSIESQGFLWKPVLSLYRYLL